MIDRAGTVLEVPGAGPRVLWLTAAMNLAALIDGHPDDAVALIARGRRTTYGTIREQVAHLRGGLIERGVEPGDRVAILAANSWYFVVAYLATLGAGAVAVPLNPASPARELQRELASVGPKVVFSGPSATAGVEALDRAAVPSLELCVAPSPSPGLEVVTYEELLASPVAPLVEREPDDLAVLVFTSGTAGAPKAAMLTHGSMRANLDQCQALPIRAQAPDDVVLGALPFFHIFGLNVVLGLTLLSGASVVLVERFEPHSTLELVVQHGVTVISGAPPMWAAWAALPGTRPGDLASVRLAASGAAPLDVQVRRTIIERFGIPLVEGYGLTEASPVVTTGTGLDAPEGSIGVPVPGVEVRLVDLDGQDALVGDPGEIWVRGPNVFAGYWEDEAATQQTLDEEGWLHTGDVAVVDDDGYLYLVDRAKDLIIVSGFNVYPAEVEELLCEHPEIDASAVVGVPHPHSGEAVKAYVVPAEGSHLDEHAVIAHCEAHLARYKCPQAVVFVDELPATATGNIIRAALR